TGLSACSLCGGSIYATRRTHGRHVRTYYGCFYHRSRGAKACPNDLTVPMDEANRLLLDALGRDVLTPAMVTGTLTDTLAAWQAEGVPALARREGMEVRLRQLNAELVHLTNALAGGAPPASVHEAIQARECERADLQAQLEHLDGLTRFTAGVDPLALTEDLGARLADWQGLLERQPIQARQILRKLLVGRLIFEPFEDAGGRGYTLRGQATYGRLLSGVYSVVPPG
ncbi:MAG TPA: zinc ribbon domain-containing protein, partial [Methylomirabilota bacterium]|nr:zinc ribbon domain-containing protein [Methylomirabilota bacterium]